MTPEEIIAGLRAPLPPGVGDSTADPVLWPFLAAALIFACILWRARRRQQRWRRQALAQVARITTDLSAGGEAPQSLRALQALHARILTVAPDFHAPGDALYADPDTADANMARAACDQLKGAL